MSSVFLSRLTALLLVAALCVPAPAHAQADADSARTDSSATPADTSEASGWLAPMYKLKPWPDMRFEMPSFDRSRTSDATREDSASVHTAAEAKAGDPGNGLHGASYPWEEATPEHVDLASPIDAYGTSALNRTLPSWRYNHVEGPTLGIQVAPLERGSDDLARVFGQVGYAFSLRDIRYTVGAEVRAVQRDRYELKIGGLYQEQTVSEDTWKTSNVENTLTGLIVGEDYFDYYEAEGATAYVTQFLPGGLRLTSGFRIEEHRALTQSTGWSVFTDDFLPNPGVDRAGERVHSLLMALEGGRLTHPDDLPMGYVFEVTAEVGNGMGGDVPFNRYVADVRGYVPLHEQVRLGLRGRAGYATAETPLQKQFTLGGVGSLPGYPQNVFRGTRSVLGNAEILFDSADLFDNIIEDVTLIGFVNAGWTGGPDRSFRTDDLLPSVGFGVGFDRNFRVDFGWPLRDVGGRGYAPSIRLRLAPNF